MRDRRIWWSRRAWGFIAICIWSSSAVKCAPFYRRVPSIAAYTTDNRTYIFPVLAEKMPQFAADGDHLKEHEGIHKGLDEYVNYIRKCRKNRKDWDGSKMRSIMDSFRTVLFKHLDHEVESLRGEEMKKVRAPLSEICWLLVLDIGGASKNTNVSGIKIFECNIHIILISYCFNVFKFKLSTYAKMLFKCQMLSQNFSIGRDIFSNTNS
jgi:hypothetical protein